MIPSNAFLSKVEEFYGDYNQVIKPLIAEIELRYEQFPTPLFNEIRAFNDHIARCFMENTDEGKELHKADGHIQRIKLDCYKYLNVHFNEKVKNFEEKTKNVDLSVIDNGHFNQKYHLLLKDAISSVREAKLKEGLNKDGALSDFELAYNKYCELESLIEDKTSEIKWANVRYKTVYYLKILGWLLAAIISGVISVVITELMK